jgi:ribonuclease P protein component
VPSWPTVVVRAAPNSPPSTPATVLAKANRVTRAADYRMTVRRGSRYGGPHLIAYVRRSAPSSAVRFGFIVGKVVGNATRRNLVRRRLKALCHDLMPRVPAGTDVVIRALPGSADVPWATLQEEVTRAVDRVSNR